MIKMIISIIILSLVIYLYRQLSITINGMLCSCCGVKAPVIIEAKKRFCSRCYITHKRLYDSLMGIQEEFNDRFNKGQISNQD